MQKLRTCRKKTGEFISKVKLDQKIVLMAILLIVSRFFQVNIAMYFLKNFLKWNSMKRHILDPVKYIDRVLNLPRVTTPQEPLIVNEFVFS